MNPIKKHIDLLRLIALIILLLGILYFFLNLFLPTKIPFFFKFGVIERPVNVLILGTDVTFDTEHGKKDVEKGRSDTMILLHFDPLKNRINMVSIPRDSYVNIPGYTFMKINAAYVLGGMDLTKKTIESILDVHIDYYVVLNTKGIVKLVDLMGGVDVDVDKDMFYTDKAQDLYINLKQGKQKLDGKQAEGFVRFRHDGLGDLGRIQRQQKFLNALSSRLANPSSLIKSPFILGLIRDNVRSNLSIKKFIMLANTARMMPKTQIRMLTLPGEPANNEAGSVILLNAAEVQEMVKENF